MAYRISMNLSPYARELVAIVPTIEAAEAKLRTMGDVIMFERDPDGHDAADAAVLLGCALEVFAIEATTE